MEEIIEITEKSTPLKIKSQRISQIIRRTSPKEILEESYPDKAQKKKYNNFFHNHRSKYRLPGKREQVTECM